VTPWWVGGPEAKKGLGIEKYLLKKIIVFLNPPHRETPKNVIKKKSRKNRFWIFGKNLSTRFVLQKSFCSVLELPSLRNTRKRDKTKKSRKKTEIDLFFDFFGKGFRHGFL
jgi:hypothetical protein